MNKDDYIKRLEESQELAWGLIANSREWDANDANVWTVAAVGWRDNYHTDLKIGTRQNTSEEIDLPETGWVKAIKKWVTNENIS